MKWFVVYFFFSYLPEPVNNNFLSLQAQKYCARGN